MKSRILLLAFGLLFCTVATMAQTATPCAPQKFLKTFGTSGLNETGLSVAPSGDGGAYVSGLAGNRALLTKFDSLGQTVWSRALALDTITQLRLFDMITDSEGRIVATGLVGLSLSAVGGTAVVFRYDPVADTVLWMKRIEGGIPLNCGILERPQNGNFVFYQTLLPNDSTLLSQVEMLELQRSSGDIVPGKSEFLSRTEPILVSNIVWWEDALYAVGAQQLASATGGIRHLLVQLDSAKYQPQWAKISHIPTTETANLLAEDLLVDNDTIVSLYANLDTTGGTVKSQIFLQKTTLIGDLVWVKQYDLPKTEGEVPIDLIQYGAGGYAIYGATDNEYFLLALNHDGQPQKSIRFSNGTPATATLLPFAKSEAYAQGLTTYLSGGFLGTDAEMSILRTDQQFSPDSCGFILPLDSVTVTDVALPFSQAISLQVSPSPTQPKSTSGAFAALSLLETLFCPNVGNFDTLDLGPDMLTCLDTNFVLDAGPGYVTYLWQDSTAAQTLITTGTGIYWVEVTDSCGFTQRDTISVTVNLANTTMFADQVLCEGGSVTLEALGFDNYQWLPNIGLSCDTCAIVTISPDSTRQYTLLATSVSGCLLNDTFLITVSQPITIADTLTGCEGDPIVIGGTAYFMNGTVTDTIPSTTGGCDTIAIYTLIFEPHPTRIVTPPLCQGDAYEINGATYTQDVMVMISVPAPGGGCDSSIVYDLKFKPLPQIQDTLTACTNDTIIFGGNAYTADTTIVDTLAAVPPLCDTLLFTHLIFTPLNTLHDTLTACANDTIVFGGNAYTADTTIVATLPAPAPACDTLLFTHLIFTPLNTLHDTLTACANDTIFLGGKIYTADTTLVDTLAAGTGCDTVRTRHLIFTPLNTLHDTLTACANDTIFLGGKIYTSDTILVDTLAASAGCDTVRTRHLLFSPLNIKTDTTLACAGDTITLGGIAFTQDTALVLDTIPAVGAGCDTIRVAQLIFRPWPVQSDTLSACVGDTIVFDGKPYLTDTTLIVDTLLAIGTGACDTLVQKVLIFNPLPTLSDTMTACVGDTITVQGIAYFSDTTLVLPSLPNTSGGCDTLVSKTLIFFPIPTFSDSLQLCAGDTVTIGGVKYFQDSTFTIQIPAPNGCDTVATYTITVLPRPLITDTLQLCQGDTVTIGGIKYFSTTTLVDTIPTTTGGCDTFSITAIIVSPVPEKNVLIQFPIGDSVIVNGVKYNFPTVIKGILPSTTGGCDTLLTTTLQWLTKLTLTCPPDLTVTTAVGDTTAVVDYDLPNLGSTCPGGGQPTITLLSGLPIGGTFPLGTTEVCYTAADTCGNVDTCCFKVTVTEGELACDVKKNDCFRWEMLPIKLDSLGNRRYRIRVINSCAEKLDYVLFRLPNGISALEPAEGSIYTPQPSGRKYIVRNPNFSPVYSVRFKADSTTVLSAGTFDIFEYKLPQQSDPKYIYTYAKLADGTYYEAHLNTFNCPELPWPNFGPGLDDRRQPTSVAMEVQMFPNPTDGALFLNFSGLESETVLLQVVNALGQCVQEVTVPVSEGLQTLQLDGRLGSGVYQLIVRPKNGLPVTERFVLERG